MVVLGLTIYVMALSQCIEGLFPQYILLFYWKIYLICVFQYKEIIHILFYNYWVGKFLFSRCTHEIFCIIQFYIRIRMEAENCGSSTSKLLAD